MTFAAGQHAKSVAQVGNTNRFPRYIKEDGTWEMLDSHAWSSGFFAGCLWFMYEYTGDTAWKKPSDPEADTSLIWGDYNFLEALMIYERGM